MNNTAGINQSYTKSESQDKEVSEISSQLGTQKNAIVSIEDAMSRLFPALNPILSGATPGDNSSKQLVLNSSLGNELQDNNSRLWAINAGLIDLLARLQL